ncbi:glycosyltransferase [Nocardia jejuensis]|uniref:glycosyltransferase n=1 Tax=Nocardia jejuensis TaxID=328049 RepID=UPI000830CF62|nr:glycosyltransferase [Nocardia jejuensis]
MRVLLSTIGSRGEVQPTLALGVELVALGAEVRVCAPPDFRELIAGFGLPFVPVGPEVRKVDQTRGLPTPEERRAMIRGTVEDQFDALGPAARGCAVVVGCGALQIAAHTIADQLGIPYVYAAFAANTLPSDHLAPPPLGLGVDTTADIPTQWQQDAQRWNDVWLEALNLHREQAGSEPITDVQPYIFTDHPWLAADPVLGPWPTPSALNVWQPGAWLAHDERPLSRELQDFLSAGDPPIYFGFGSMQVAPETARAAIDAARALGRRAIILRGWAELGLVDDAPDCLAVGEVNHRALFPRVAAAVHHGGAGTTATVASAGAPQVVVPQRFDQFYWAQRVEDLGIGVAHAAGQQPTTDSLTDALRRVLTPEIGDRARSIAPTVRADGAVQAAKRVVELGTR